MSIDLRCIASSLALLVLGCNPPEVRIAFAGLVGGMPAACGATYHGIGTTSADLTLADFRLYVHDVRLVTEDGREVPLALTNDAWQHEGVALLDFEDGSTGCESGTSVTNAIVHGTTTESGPFTGVRLKVGVPFELNHADASTAPSPLDYTSMFWSWNLGYKFVRVDALTSQPEGFHVHLGSTGCAGDGRGNVTCAEENLAEVALDGFDPEADTIAVDVADLLSESAIDTNQGGPPGCQGSYDDADCEPIFHALGLTYGGVAAPAPQRFFSVQ